LKKSDEKEREAQKKRSSIENLKISPEEKSSNILKKSPSKENLKIGQEEKSSNILKKSQEKKKDESNEKVIKNRNDSSSDSEDSTEVVYFNSK